MDTCDITMSDVIARSIAMHPSTLADAMRAIAKIHTDAALAITHDAYASRIARSMACDANACADDIENNELDPDRLQLRVRIMLFGAASRLLCIPLSVQKAIAAR